MKKFDIYLWEVEDDKLLGSVVAKDIITAEIIGSEKFQVASDRIYALSAREEQ